jgi:hypothetical protein
LLLPREKKNNGLQAMQSKYCTLHRVPHFSEAPIPNLSQEEEQGHGEKGPAQVALYRKLGTGGPLQETRHRWPSIGNTAQVALYRKHGTGGPLQGTQHRWPSTGNTAQVALYRKHGHFQVTFSKPCISPLLRAQRLVYQADVDRLTSVTSWRWGQRQ